MDDGGIYWFDGGIFWMMDDGGDPWMMEFIGTKDSVTLEATPVFGSPAQAFVFAFVIWASCGWVWKK